jgi:transposase
VDTSRQVLSGVRRRRWPIGEKQRIVEETLAPGASVARTAQRYALNANQIFKWRKEYREEVRLKNGAGASLLPVKVSDEHLAQAASGEDVIRRAPLGTLEIKLAKGKLQITGRVDLLTLRTAIECLVQ